MKPIHEARIVWKLQKYEQYKNKKGVSFFVWQIKPKNLLRTLKNLRLKLLAQYKKLGFECTC